MAKSVRVFSYSDVLN